MHMSITNRKGIQKFGIATGLVGVLVLAGVALHTSGTSPELGLTAAKGGVYLGLALGGLGIVGVIITIGKRLIG